MWKGGVTTSAKGGYDRNQGGWGAGSGHEAKVAT